MTPEMDLDQLARTMVRAPDIARDYVIDRLAMAARVIEATAGRAGPGGAGSWWPSIIMDVTGLEPDKRRDFSPTPRQIAEAEEAMAWRRYVTDPKCLRALNLWMAAKARRTSWKKLAERQGLVVRTVERRQSRAISLIVYGLAADGFRPRPH